MRSLLILLGSVLAITAHAQERIEIKDRSGLPGTVYNSLKDSRAILLGEVHGNNESPEFARGMIDLWLAEGNKVMLGLEINQDNQDAVDKFLRSGDTGIIKSMPFFNRKWQDGRSSTAMAQLIRAMYKRKDLKVVCLDMPSAIEYSPKRDSIMGANAVEALKRNPEWKLITLTGNVHNQLELSGFGYPMGYWVLNSDEIKLNKQKVSSVNIVYQGGDTWVCQGRDISGCGVHEQGNLSGEFAQKCLGANCFLSSGEEKVLFTRSISASLPLNR